MQLEEYLREDDRIVLPLGSVEQHAYLSLAVDQILAERVSVEAAQPLGVPVLPALPYGIAPYFAAYPGSPTLSAQTYGSVLRELIDALHGQGFHRFLLVNGHGGNEAGRPALDDWAAAHPEAEILWHNWWNAPRTWAEVQAVDPDASHASWLENFPWTRLAGVDPPRERKAMVDVSRGARGGSGRRARAARRRLVRRALRAARRGRPADLAGRRRGSPRGARDGLA